MLLYSQSRSQGLEECGGDTGSKGYSLYFHHLNYRWVPEAHVFHWFSVNTFIRILSRKWYARFNFFFTSRVGTWICKHNLSKPCCDLTKQAPSHFTDTENNDECCESPDVSLYVFMFTNSLCMYIHVCACSKPCFKCCYLFQEKASVSLK